MALSDSPNFDTRYISLSDNESALALDFTLNEVLSRSTTIVRTLKLKTESNLVARVNLSHLGIDSTLWDTLFFDEPYFTSTISGKKITVLPNLPQLIQATGSRTPIVRHDWLQFILNRDKYYQARGIERSNDPKVTDFDLFIKKFANVDIKTIESLRSDQKYAMFFSGVTGKPRAVLVINGSASRPGVNQNLLMITQDINDEDRAAIKHPIRSLLDFKPTAREVICEMNNGFHAFSLFNDKGQLQNVVPPNVAKDHTVPEPYTAELIPRISCVRCHKTEGGIRSVTNDVAKLSKVLDILDSDIDRLAGLYSGTLDKPFSRARDDYSDQLTILKSQYDLKISPLDKLSQIYEQYQYKRINLAQAQLEIGTKSNFDLPKDTIEDPIIGALKAGLTISRVEFEQVFPDLLTRVIP